MAEGEERDMRAAYDRAEKLVAEKIGFLRHLTVFVVINVVLVAINLATSSDFLWFLLPLGAWAILLLAHFLIVFAFRGERFERWRRRQIEDEVERLREGD
jgi:pilus assembly protein TadC